MKKRSLSLFLALLLVLLPVLSAVGADTILKAQNFDSIATGRILPPGAVDNSGNTTSLTSYFSLGGIGAYTAGGVSMALNRDRQTDTNPENSGVKAYIEDGAMRVNVKNGTGNVGRKSRFEMSYSLETSSNVITPNVAAGQGVGISFSAKISDYFNNGNNDVEPRLTVRDKNNATYVLLSFGSNGALATYGSTDKAAESGWKNSAVNTIEKNHMYDIDVYFYPIDGDNQVKYDVYVDGVKKINKQIFGNNISYQATESPWFSGADTEIGIRSFVFEFDKNNENALDGEKDIFFDNVKIYFPEVAPAVAAVTPADNTDELSIFTNKVSLGFNGKMDSSTLNNITITSSEGNLSCTGVYNSLTDVYDMLFTADLQPHTEYTITVPNTVKAISGTAVTPFTSSFETGSDGSSPISFEGNGFYVGENRVFEITSGNLTAKPVIENTSSQPLDLLLTLVAYKNGKISKLGAAAPTVGAKATETLPVTVNGLTDEDEVKLFIWQDNFAPITDEPVTFGDIGLESINISAPKAVAENGSKSINVTGVMEDGSPANLSSAVITYQSSNTSYVTVSEDYPNTTASLMGVNDGLDGSGNVSIIDTSSNITVSVTLDGKTISKTIKVVCGPLKINPELDMEMVRWRSSGDHSPGATNATLVAVNSTATKDKNGDAMGNGYGIDRMSFIKFDLPNDISMSDISSADIILKGSVKLAESIVDSITEWPLHMFASGDDLTATTYWNNKPSLAGYNSSLTDIDKQKPTFPTSVKDSPYYGTEAGADNCYLATQSYNTTWTAGRFNVTDYLKQRVNDPLNVDKKASVCIWTDAPESNGFENEDTATKVLIRVESSECTTELNRPILLLTLN